MNLTSRILIITFFFVSITSTAQLALNASYDETSENDLIEKDFNAPRTDLLRTESGAFVFGPATRIKFKIIEEESGLATTYFKIADLPYMKSDGRQMVPHQLADGSYKIEYYSTDKAGNQEQIRTDKIYIDKKGPKIRAAFNSTPASFENGSPIFSSDVHLIVEASDDQVEVQKLTYKINGGPVVVSESKNFMDLSKEIAGINDELIKIEIHAYDTFYNHSKEVVEFKKK